MGNGPVSDTVTRDTSLTVRLSQPERAQLERLADHYDLDRSAAMRHALAEAHRATLSLPSEGCFIAVGTADVQFPIRLSGNSYGES